MTRRRVAVWGLLVAILAGTIAVAAVVIPKWYIQPAVEPDAPDAAPQPAARKIRARLFHVAEDGQRLVPVDREVTFGEGPLEQARHLVEAELAEAPKPFYSPIPAGTKLRAVYVSPTGEAYVDLSRDVASAHPGGALNELLTVYAIVNVLTSNLPAITAVQILVDGREVDTLAGHVDLRRPLPRNNAWAAEGGATATSGTPAPPVPAGAPAVGASPPQTVTQPPPVKGPSCP